MEVLHATEDDIEEETSARNPTISVITENGNEHRNTENRASRRSDASSVTNDEEEDARNSNEETSYRCMMRS